MLDDESNPSQMKSQFDGAGQIIFLMAVFIFSFSLGVVRYEIMDLNPLDTNLENAVGEKVSISGVVSTEPVKKDAQEVLTVDFKNLSIASSTVSVSGKGIISTDLYPGFQYGDLIKISGKLEKPTNLSAPNGSSTIPNPDASVGTSNFDYVSYLAKDNIFYEINFAKTELISSGHGNFIQSYLFKIKNSFIDKINKTIIEPESSLLGGILLGAKSSMDKNTTEIFRKAGLSHIVALSGYNITVVADAITKILSFLPRSLGFSGGVLGIILFVIMSGSSSTAVRAGIMALTVILADITHRNYQVGRALMVAGLLMVIVNPKILVFDFSFQLSFLATVAIIYVSPILKRKFIFITEKFGLRDTIALTISAQILVLPLILYQMGTISLVALPANILVLAFIPATMFFGFIVGVFGMIWLPLLIPFAWISWILLAYMINVSKFFANLPFSVINISWFSVPIMTVYYFLITIWIVRQNRKSYPVVKFNENKNV